MCSWLLFFDPNYFCLIPEIYLFLISIYLFFDPLAIATDKGLYNTHLFTDSY